MNSQIEQISSRIKELREILELAPEQIASKIGLTLEEYQNYESAKNDIPIGVLYAIATELGIDPTVLLTGESPRMDEYTIVRNGRGINIERYPGYSFSSLAFNYKHREMEPLLVTLSPNEEAELVIHGGQEFNYVIEGKIRIIIGDKEFLLNAGDSIYFNPALPHGQRAVGKEAKFLTIINE